MSTVFHWQDESGAHHLGRVADVYDNSEYGQWVGIEVRADHTGKRGPLMLVQHLYTGILEWVPERLLRPYPSEKIESPS